MKDYISVPANSSVDYIADEIESNYIADEFENPSAYRRYLSDEHVCTLCEHRCIRGDCRSCNFPLVHALKDIGQYLVMLRGH